MNNTGAIRNILICSVVLNILAFIGVWLCIFNPQWFTGSMSSEYNAKDICFVNQGIYWSVVALINCLLVCMSIYILKYKKTLNKAVFIIGFVWAVLSILFDNLPTYIDITMTSLRGGSNEVAALSLVISKGMSFVKKLNIFGNITMLSGIFAGVLNKENNIEV